MAALLGEDTLFRLLPLLSKGSFNNHNYLML